MLCSSLQMRWQASRGKDQVHRPQAEFFKSNATRALATSQEERAESQDQ